MQGKKHEEIIIGILKEFSNNTPVTPAFFQKYYVGKRYADNVIIHFKNLGIIEEKADVNNKTIFVPLFNQETKKQLIWLQNEQIITEWNTACPSGLNLEIDKTKIFGKETQDQKLG